MNLRWKMAYCKVGTIIVGHPVATLWPPIFSWEIHIQRNRKVISLAILLPNNEMWLYRIIIRQGNNIIAQLRVDGCRCVFQPRPLAAAANVVRFPGLQQSSRRVFGSARAARTRRLGEAASHTSRILWSYAWELLWIVINSELSHFMHISE